MVSIETMPYKHEYAIKILQWMSWRSVQEGVNYKNRENLNDRVSTKKVVV